MKNNIDGIDNDGNEVIVGTSCVGSIEMTGITTTIIYNLNEIGLSSGVITSEYRTINLTGAEVESLYKAFKNYINDYS